MLVSEYCRRDVVVVEESQTPLEAAIAMRECHAGDVVVVSREGKIERPIGIISDRDIATEIVAEKVEPTEVTVKDIIIRELITIEENEDLSQCILLMKKHAARRLPVVSTQGALVGIISVDDVIEVLSSHINDFALLFNTPPKPE